MIALGSGALMVRINGGGSFWRREVGGGMCGMAGSRVSVGRRKKKKETRKWASEPRKERKWAQPKATMKRIFSPKIEMKFLDLILILKGIEMEFDI